MCIGHVEGSLDSGDTAAQVFNNLRARFCGCTHVSGNIRISLLGASGILDENDFDIFFHLEQISGALYLDNIPVRGKILFPNLRLIRGNELEGGMYAIVIRNISVDEILFPKLTEITRGGVFVEQMNGVKLCNLLRVDWNNILDNGNTSFKGNPCDPHRDGKYCKISTATKLQLIATRLA